MCPNCGAKTIVQSAGGFTSQDSIWTEEFEPAPGIIDIRWLNLFGLPTPKSSKEADAQVRPIRTAIEKSLDNVFISFPHGQPLYDERMRNIYAGIYHSEFFKDLPLQPGDRWDSLRLSDDIQLRIIRLVKGFLSASDWTCLRVRNLGGLKNRYASGFLEVSFACPHCAQKLEVDAEGSGMIVSCPTCGNNLTIPQPSPKSPKPKAQRPRKPRVTGSDSAGPDAAQQDPAAGLHREQKE